MRPVETPDFYELVVERHKRTATSLTSNRDDSKMIGVMSDPLLAQSAVDRLDANSYELVIDAESYRRDNDPDMPPSTAPRLDQKESTDEPHHAALVVHAPNSGGGARRSVRGAGGSALSVGTENVDESACVEMRVGAEAGCAYRELRDMRTMTVLTVTGYAYPIPMSRYTEAERAVMLRSTVEVNIG